MPSYPSLLVVSLALLLACTRSSDVAVTSGEVQSQPDRPPAPVIVELEQPAPRPRCNRVVTDVEAALVRARKLLPDPASSAAASEWPEETIELWLLPAVPPDWPATDCRLVFYVFAWFEIVPHPRNGLFGEDPLPYAWLGIEAKITVALDTGVSAIEPVEGQPGGVTPRHGTGPMSSADQQLLFDAVVSGSAMSAETIAVYHEWFTNHPYPSFMFWIWHRDFFDALVGADEALRTEISNSAKAFLRGAGPADWADFETWLPPRRTPPPGL